MRYERKYRVEHLGYSEVVALTRIHPLGFHTAYPDRWVNNIYLDTPDLQALRDKLNGVSNRVKFRIRWYGEDLLNARHPSLESKIRVGELGEKTSRPLPPFAITSRAALVAYVKEQVATPWMLEPVLVNRYLRSYYVSASGKFRLTIDREMEFRNVGPGFFSLLNHAKDPAIVVEVKYDESLDDEWGMASERLPFRLSRNSKYVNGMMLIGRELEG